MKPIPQYKPPQKKDSDWRKDQAEVSDDDELPDPNKGLDLLKRRQGGNDAAVEDPGAKFSIMDGDQTKYEEPEKKGKNEEVKEQD